MSASSRLHRFVSLIVVATALCGARATETKLCFAEDFKNHRDVAPRCDNARGISLGNDAIHSQRAQANCAAETEGLLFTTFVPETANEPQAKSAFTVDDHTIMLLQPGADGTMTDAKKNFTPTVNGATTVNDASLGQVLQFGTQGLTGISVDDGGKIDLSRGMTLEMWLQIQDAGENPTSGGSLFAKMKSFYTTIVNRTVNVEWMTFPNDTIATTTKTQYNYYPVSDTGFPGYIAIPANRWVHVAITYDPVLKVARSFVDGKLDWTEYYQRKAAMPLENDVNSALSFVGGMKNVSVGEIRVSNVARAIDTLTPFETYVHALPYRKKSAVIFDHIQATALPLDVVLASEGKELQRFLLTEPKTKTVVFNPPVSTGQYALTITAASNGKVVYSKNADIYAGDDSNDPVTIDAQNRLVMNGKPIFPVFIYHTFVDDLPLLAKMGFTMYLARYPDSHTTLLPSRDDKTIAINKQFLDVGRANTIYMLAGGGIFGAGGGSTNLNIKGIEALDSDPALAIWWGEDEPGRTTIEALQPGYTAVKQIGTRPIFSLTNRAGHMQRLAETTDILGSDPYPIPNVSMRMVADHTKYTIKATAGLKPVWTVIPQYQYHVEDNKRPSEQEFRCMAYLAIASGAQGLGVYAWDDRDAFTKKGWYTKEHSEDLKILETMVQELKGLQNVLIIPNSARRLTLTPDNPAIHVVMKEAGEEQYLFVVNDSRVAEEATLSIADVQNIDGVDIHDANQKMSIRDGKAHLALPAMEARIYKLAPIKSL